MFDLSAKQILLWIKDQEISKDKKEAFYFLLNEVCGISKTDIYNFKINSEKIFKLKENFDTFNSKWKEYDENNKPVQYITGNSYWRNFNFLINEDVLIPRVETEQIVDIIAKNFHNNDKEILFADLGTGSGVIGISLAILNKNWKGVAVDIDKSAIQVAERNFNRLAQKKNLEFFSGNWWEPLEAFKGKIDIAISNPPYIPADIYDELPSSVKNHEPKIALIGGDDGLLHIKKIIIDCPKFIKKGGWLILENHYDQGLKVRDLLLKSGFNSVQIINDLFGIGRFTIGRYK